MSDHPNRNLAMNCLTQLARTAAAYDDSNPGGALLLQEAQVYATLDVADAIRGLREDIGVCPHGSTGICMYCMRDFMAVRS